MNRKKKKRLLNDLKNIRDRIYELRKSEPANKAYGYATQTEADLNMFINSLEKQLESEED